MQVSHSTRPFVSRLRVAPGAASAPDRVVVDLEKMRKLAAILEEQADQLTRLPLDDGEMESEPDAKDRGTQAVEARLRSLCEALEKAFPDAEEDKVTAKKVCAHNLAFVLASNDFMFRTPLHSTFICLTCGTLSTAVITVLL